MIEEKTDELAKRTNFDKEARAEVSIVVTDYRKWVKDENMFSIISFWFG